MSKIAIIGAGSHVFTANLVKDILSHPEHRSFTISLMDLNHERLDLVTSYSKNLVKQHGLNATIESTSDRRAALEGADYVVVTIRVGGLEANKVDIEIPAKYGIIQGVGDTIGPGGVFYGMRQIPVLLDICHDMEELCPDALLLNYSNPMAMICWAVNRYTKIRNIGLCHSVQSTSAELARYLGAKLEDVTYWVAGINHMAWFLKLRLNGRDAYPILREKFKDADLYTRPDAHWAGADIVRAEIFKAFGYFVTESSQHMSEYVPYFRKRPDFLERYKLVYRLESTNEMTKSREKRDAEMRKVAINGEKIPLDRSREYCSYIINSIETGLPRRVNVNVNNLGLITNLPNGCCVEIPCMVDDIGVHPLYVGDLPPQCASLNRTNINVQELGVLAAVENDKNAALQAILLDPLTSSLLTIDETRKMVEEMFNAEKIYLNNRARTK
ncbi:MAG: alpha-glucosidase/alpha-galactosidase [Candidatus Bathyarchaeota archaeon]|nr:alpha-glucosidase/alpha-galactosidase [Candidatus Bathyarchaeota archaeon]